MARNKGFTIVEVMIVIVLIALVGFIGWRVWTANQQTDMQDVQTTTQTEEVPTINSEQDLDKATEQLDETNIEGSESQQLDTETSF